MCHMVYAIRKLKVRGKVHHKLVICLGLSYGISKASWTIREGRIYPLVTRGIIFDFDFNLLRHRKRFWYCTKD